ncbi:MAG TPA: PAN domain-containing protein [Beijerinckiaceae bacterium]
MRNLRIHLLYVVFAVVLASPAAAQTEEPNTDRRSGAETEAALPRASPPNCMDACLGNGSCRAWTFVANPAGSGGACFLSNQSVPARPAPCCISGEVR